MDKLINYITDKITDVENKIKTDPPIFGIVSLFVNIIIIGSIYYFNPYNFTDKYPFHTFLIVLLILLLTVITFFYIRVKRDIINVTNTSFFDSYQDYLKNNGYFLLFLITFIFSIYLLFFVWDNIDLSLDSFQSFIINVINISVIIGALSLIYKALSLDTDVLSDYKTQSIPVLLLSLIKTIIFYIPCIFIDIIEYVKEENKITTKTIWIILLIEIIFITLYFLLPTIFINLYSHDGIQLLKESEYLNEKRILGTFEELYKVKDNVIPTPGDVSNSKYKYNYSISAWFYINPQPPNTNPSYNKFTTILDYGKKPIVEYKASKNILRVQCETSNDNLKTLYETKDIKLQRWNNIVINYDSGTMDVFINGNLVSSRSDIAPYMSYENITVGENGGVHGGICNVNYYNHIVSSSNINSSYKLLRNKSIPI